MIAKIVDKDRREYYSAVFAICEMNWNTAVVVYDDEKRCFSYIKMYGNTKNIVRSVFIIDCDDTDFVKNKSVKIGFCKTIKHINGYAWLVENKQLFADILKNRKVNDCYKEKAEKINRKISIGEWTIVKSENDIDSLMSTAWGFHDGIVEKIDFDYEKDTVEICFSGCWGCKMTLHFQYDVEISFSTDMKWQMIMDSNVFFENGFVYWVDEAEIKSQAELAEAKGRNYFKGRTLSWKQQTEYEEEN